MRQKQKNRILHLECQITKDGFKLITQSRSFMLRYPDVIWKNYPQHHKSFLVDNLAYTLSANIPLVSSVNKIIYKNTSEPFIRPYIDLCIYEQIPSAINSYKDNTLQQIANFSKAEFCFKDDKVKIPPKTWPKTTKKKAILPLSFGKDSLSTLGLLLNRKVKPIGIYINDTVSPSENIIKLFMAERIEAEQNINTSVVFNEIEKLNDFEYWQHPESSLGYMHMIIGFVLICLPFAYYYKTSNIYLGNQMDMDYPFTNKEGILTYPAPDQNSKWLSYVNQITQYITGQAVRVDSLIKNYSNIALIKLLHENFPYLGQYEVSCDSLDASNEVRWCCNCAKCARLSIFMKAFNINTQSLGMKSDMLLKRHQKLYSLFNTRGVDQYEQSPQAKEQQLLAFYLAYENGQEGYLMDYFKKKYLKKATSQLKQLKKKYL